MSTQKRLSLHTMVFAGSTKTNCAFPATESVPKSKQRTEVNTIYLFIHPPFGRLGEPPLHGEAPVSCKMTPLKSRLLQQNHLMHLSKVSSGNLVEVDSTRNVFGVPDRRFLEKKDDLLSLLPPFRYSHGVHGSGPLMNR
jgi:hypothetical protein